MNIAIVEDLKLIQEGMISRLKNKFDNVNIAFTATGPDDAIEFLSNNITPDFIILDIMLSRGTGFEILDWLEKKL